MMFYQRMYFRKNKMDDFRKIQNSEDKLSKMIKQMSWDEIQKLMDEKIRNGSWATFVKSLGQPPHIIKHDYLLSKIK